MSYVPLSEVDRAQALSGIWVFLAAKQATQKPDQYSIPSRAAKPTRKKTPKRLASFKLLDTNKTPTTTTTSKRNLKRKTSWGSLGTHKLISSQKIILNCPHLGTSELTKTCPIRIDSNRSRHRFVNPYLCIPFCRHRQKSSKPTAVHAITSG